jgi:hypothetical protein
MSANLLEDKTKSVPNRLICESCGEEFSCGVNIGECWCFAVEVKAETLAELKKSFKSCLCQDCLISIKENVHSRN